MDMKILFTPVLVLIFSMGAACAQDIAAGEASYRKCQPCHAIGEGAKTLIGPPLNGLEGHKAGTVGGANYSQALKSSGIIWNEQTFKEYVQNPVGKVPGTMMMLAVRDEKELGDLWAFLKQFGSDGKKK
jgi:cytochrome c